MNTKIVSTFIAILLSSVLAYITPYAYGEATNTVKTNLIRSIPITLQKIASNSSSAKASPVTKQHIAILESRAYEVTDKTYVESKKDPSKGFVDLYSPKNTFITTKRPVFKWEPVPGAVKYEFKLINSIKELWSTSINNTEITLPTSMSDLQEGKFYFWAVRAVGVSNYFSPYSYFYIATTKEKETLNNAVDYFNRILADKNPVEKDIILASLYESKGYYGLAEKYYLSAKNNTTNSDESKDIDLLMGNLYVKTDRLNKAVKLLGLKK